MARQMELKSRSFLPEKEREKAPKADILAALGIAEEQLEGLMKDSRKMAAAVIEKKVSEISAQIDTLDIDILDEGKQGALDNFLKLAEKMKAIAQSLDYLQGENTPKKARKAGKKEESGDDEVLSPERFAKANSG